MAVQINNEGVAVDHAYFWRPMATCPPGVKVQLLTTGGVAVYGTAGPRAISYLAWAPLPKRPLWLIEHAQHTSMKPSTEPHGY